MSDLYRVKKYFQYKLHAKNEHSIHSPFVFKLYTEVIKSKNQENAFEVLNKIREELLQNNETIEITDLGAGSKKMGTTRKISDIAKYSVVNQKYGELLFRLIAYFKPQTILELGTSLGLSALYLSKAALDAEISTVEGCPNTHRFATTLLERHAVRHGESTSLNQIECINTRFDDFFRLTKANQTFGLVYIDGNHTYEATTKYFHELLKVTNESSVLIFDDIYWSDGMTKAWEEIRNHERVTLSVDLYKIGLIFFRKENKQKEHFCLRF